MKTKILTFFLIGIAVPILFSGCASIFTKSTYPVSINSDPEGAEIYITDGKGRPVYEGETPAVVKLKSSSGYFSKADYTVTLNYPGYKEQTIFISSKIEGWYFGNILVGGLLGFLIIDPLTGAMWTLDTEEINVKLKPSTSAETASLQILNINNISDEMKSKLVRIN